MAFFPASFCSADRSVSESIFELVVALLHMILMPKILRSMSGADDDEGLDLFSIVAFFTTCAAATYGEYWLIQKYFGG